MAIGAVVVIQVVCAAASGGATWLQSHLPVQPLVAQAIVRVALLVLLLGVCFATFAEAFRLSFRRAFAPFGAFLGTQILGAAVTLGLLRPRCVESFVGSGSMSPTIAPSDCFVVNKLLAPRRNDLIAFHATAPRPGAPGPVYCKRLLGLPGERLCIEHGGLSVDGRAIALPPSMAGRLTAVPASGARFLTPRHADGDPFTLGPDEHFVVVDDVDHSADSRIEPPIHRDCFVGVVDLLYWPPWRAKIVR